MGIKNIFIGFSNLLTGKETPQEKQRLEICQKCPHIRQDKRCGICKCYTPAKVKAPKEKCPINKW